MLRAAALGVQTQQTVAKLPIWNLALAMQQARDMALNSVDRSSDLRLCQAGFHEFGDDLFPHVTIIMILFPSVNISAGILSKIYQESVDIGKHNPDNDYIATTTQENEMTNTVKSVTPVQNRQIKGGGFKLVVSGGQGGWDVRIRYTDGTEKLLCGDFPYTLAQAGSAAQNFRGI